jgi:hypothetical protein
VDATEPETVGDATGVVGAFSSALACASVPDKTSSAAQNATPRLTVTIRIANLLFTALGFIAKERLPPHVRTPYITCGAFSM